MFSSDKIDPIIRKLFSDDPLHCMSAIEPLAVEGPKVFRAIALSDIAFAAPLANWFLRELTIKIGKASGPVLMDLVADAQLSWKQKDFLPPCFSGLAYDSAIAAALVKFCNPEEHDIELCRLSFSSFGYYGVYEWNFLLSEYCFYGRNFRTSTNKLSNRFNHYTFGKLWPYYMDALICSLCRKDLLNPGNADSIIHSLEDLVQRLDEHNPNAFNYVSFYFNKRIGNYSPAVIDPVMRRWMNHKDDRFQSAAVAIISQILPSRISTPIFNLAKNGRSDLGVIAGELFSERSCKTLKKNFDFDAGDKFFRWTFSLLFGFPFDWEEWDMRATEILEILDEPALMLLYTMAAKGDERSIEQVDIMLDAMDLNQSTSATPSFTRGVGYLCLALTDPHRAKVELPELYDCATDKTERLFAAAALCMAGHRSGGIWLHNALVKHRQAQLLRPVWKHVLARLIHRGVDTGWRV